MNEYKLIIDGRLPGLNDYQKACRTNKYKGGEFKKSVEAQILPYIIRDLKGVKIEKLVDMHYIWFEPNKKRDKDNISSFGRKCIQDALVKSGVLINDNWGYIDGFTDSFFIDSENPRVEVRIVEKEA